MRRFVFAGLVTLVTAPAWGAGYGLKPGLWQSRMVKEIVDGRDMTAQMVGMASQMRQELARFPPEQRARIEAMMKAHGGASMGADATVKMCITPALSKRQSPFLDRSGHCQPATMTRIGNRTNFTINCRFNGNTTVGKGESTATGDIITSRIDMTTHSGDGKTRVVHSETEMKYLGPDCGDVKPISVPKAPR